MFRTIFTVTKKTCESTDYEVYFEDFEKAKKFAVSESKKLSDGIIVHYGHHYPDGSLHYVWADKSHEVFLDDYAWITDFRVNGIGFYHSGGILSEFDDYDSLKAFIKRSQEIALN